MEYLPGIIGLIICLFIYFIPSWVGSHKKNSTAIFILNLFLGWTFIGWVVALIWATMKQEGDEEPKNIYSKIGEMSQTTRNVVYISIVILSVFLLAYLYIKALF